MYIYENDAKAWSALMQKAAPEKEKKRSPKLYLALYTPPTAMDGFDCTIEAVTADQLKDKSYHKLNLTEISMLSRRILLWDGTDKKSDILEGLERLISSKAQRIDEARITRGFLRVLSYLLLVIGVGLILKNMLDAPEDDIETADRTLRNIYFQDVEKQIYDQQIVERLEQSEKEFKDKSLEELKTDKSKMQTVFAKDQTRTVHHIIIKEEDTHDEKGKKKDGKIIHDAQRASNKETSEEQRLEFAKVQFEKFKTIIGEDDEKWLVLLQLIFTQQTSTPLNGELIGHCLALNHKIGENWYYLQDISPITTVVTPLRGEKIEKLHVVAKVTSAFFHKIQNLNTVVKDEQIPGKTIDSTLEFEIFFDEKQELQINIIDRRHEMH